MPDRFWRVYNHVARAWYETEYGRVEFPDRWYWSAMDLLERVAAAELRWRTVRGGRT